MAEQKRSTLAACEQELKKGYTETRGYVGVDGDADSILNEAERNVRMLSQL